METYEGLNKSFYIIDEKIIFSIPKLTLTRNDLSEMNFTQGQAIPHRFVLA